MRRLTVSLFLVLAACSEPRTPGVDTAATSRKLGVAGATCGAAADCAADLQCFASVCATAPAAVPTADTARDKADVEQKAATAVLLAELKGLKDEQNRLEGERRSLAEKLNTVTDETERQRLLDVQKELDNKIADNKKTQVGGAREKRTVTVKKNVDDPLEGL